MDRHVLGWHHYYIQGPGGREIAEAIIKPVPKALGEKIQGSYLFSSRGCRIDGAEYLHRLWVSPMYRRAGYGRRLLQEAIRHARSKGKHLVLRVTRFAPGGPYEEQLVQFYADHGFVLLRELRKQRVMVLLNY